MKNILVLSRRKACRSCFRDERRRNGCLFSANPFALGRTNRDRRVGGCNHGRLPTALLPATPHSLPPPLYTGVSLCCTSPPSRDPLTPSCSCSPRGPPSTPKTSTDGHHCTMQRGTRWGGRRSYEHSSPRGRRSTKRITAAEPVSEATHAQPQRHTRLAPSTEGGCTGHGARQDSPLDSLRSWWNQQ